MKRLRRVRFATALVLVVSTAAAAAPSEPSIANARWEIVSIDGQAVAPGRSGDVETAPALVFSGRSYSAYAGCNAMGGLYLLHGARIATYPGPQTLIACHGPEHEQERVIDAVMRGGPMVGGSNERLTLTTGKHRVMLKRAALIRATVDPPVAWQGERLAGQRFELRSFGGINRNAAPLPILRFAATSATITGVCRLPLTGRFTQKGSRLVLGWPPLACAARLPSGQVDMVSGPNGELLLAGGGHWIAGDNLRRDRPK